MGEGRSALQLVLLGCLGMAMVLVAVVAVGGYWVYQWGQGLEAEMKDPEARHERALEILGAETLPDGYHPFLGMEAPFFGSTAILSDRKPAFDEGDESLGDRAFIYVETVGWGLDEAALRGYFEGETSDPEVLADNGIEVDVGQVLDRGVIPGSDSTVWYLTQRGDIGARQYEGGGIGAVILVDCPDDERRRLGIWFVPDPAPEAPVEELDLAGTPADPDAIEAFMGHFSPCR